MDFHLIIIRKMKRQMIRKVSSLLLYALSMFAFSAHAAGGDSTKYLSRDNFLSIVRSYHPVVQQADIRVKLADANIQQARGAFDPTAGAGLDRKTFDGKNYYNYFNTEVVIPTWYGIDIKAGIEDVSGSRVTAESTLGESSYLGVKITPTSLIMDKRRAILRQAQAMRQLSEAEQRLMVNNLLFDALAAYFNWVKEYEVLRILTNTVRVNEQRLKFVKIEYEQGARAAIDTTESAAQLQSFYQQLSAAQMAFNNAGLDLANYMWLDNEIPYTWNADVVPVPGADTIETTPELPPVEQLAAQAQEHPKVQSLGSKLNVLEIDKTLKAQYLLPKLSVSANMLGKGYYVPSDISTTMLQNNHKLGVDLNFPLLFREQRGAYNGARLKIEDTRLEQNQITLQVENKIRSYYTEVLSLRQQLQFMQLSLSSYETLYTGERLRFEVGESSLFILNSRENKLLETAQKLAELKMKYQKSRVGLVWATGQLQ